MVTLHAGSKALNIQKSVNNRVKTDLADTDGYTVDWGQPGFKDENTRRWIQFRLLSNEGTFQRQVDSTRLGNILNWFLNFNIFERHPPTDNIYNIDAVKDAIFERIYRATITIYDYDTGGNPEANTMQVQTRINDGEIDDGRETGLYQWNSAFSGKLLKKYS